MTSQRAIDLNSGKAMIVTDLHGAGPVYDHLRATFLRAYQAGQVQHWVICGDLIHGYGDGEDHSLRMLLDVMQLQRELGPETVILLLGNHEMPHIYGITLSKGKLTFTPDFEHALARLEKQPFNGISRADVMAFLMDAPFFVRTQAGVMLTHAGAANAVKSAQVADHLLTFDHRAVLKLADDHVAARFDPAMVAQNAIYIEQAREMLAADGPQHPRFLDLLRGQLISQTSEDFILLWDVLFTQNEADTSALRSYSSVVSTFLKHISTHSPHPQRVVVAGHIGVRGGHAIVGGQQLRLASYAHASPKSAGQYLLLDCAAPVTTPDDLLPHLRPTFAQG